jgi:hypothetical protein
MLFFLLCAAMIVAWRWPETPVGRILHRLLVAWPAHQLARLDDILPKRASGKLLLLLLIVLTVSLAIVVARNDGLIFLAQGMPEGIAWSATFDIATYLDVVALGLMLGATIRLRAVYVALRSWLARTALGRVVRRVSGARTRSPRPERKAPPPSNDEEPAWPGLGLAYR